MARYTGPKTKISRRFGVSIFGPSKALERRNYPPGIHGPKGARRKQSEYSVALAEKQKLRYQYGILERQFRRYFEIALKTRGVTGEILLQLLETRLDNIVYRLGFATSRRAARQLVLHRHVKVNGRRANVPSMLLKPGDRIEARAGKQSEELIRRALETTQSRELAAWLALDKEALRGEVLRVPTREEIGPFVNEQLVVELYSK